MKKYEKILKALANKRRLEILKFLKTNGKSTVGDLAEELKLSFKATSKHLNILFNNEIIEKEQKGLFHLYYLSDDLDILSKKLISIL